MDETTLCIRCQVKPYAGVCCSAHGKQLCHLCYRRTHFVEVCVAGCGECAAEGPAGVAVRLRQAGGVSVTTNDIDAIRTEWASQCGSCDYGLPYDCTCPKGDYRPRIAALCDEIEQLRAYAETTRYHQQQHAEAVREIERMRAEREHMELNPTGTVEWLKNRVNELTAELAQAQESARYYSALVGERNEQIANVRRLSNEYKDRPPPLFRGPGLSERGEGYNAGTRDMARAVLGTLDGAEEVEP